MKLHCWYSTVILTSAALHFAPSPASADAAADAVRAARSTALPDFEGVISEGRNTGALDGFGGGNLDQVRDAEALYRDGDGLLYAPATNRVVGCRSASDPECRAVQVLDRGFPERPSVPEDVLIGRDDVVENAAGSRPGGIGSSESCRDFTITIPERVETEVCSAGSPFADFTCRTGWETSTEILTRWACRMGSAYREALACRIVSRPGTVTETPVACWFGPDALTPSKTYEEITTARAFAEFPARCEAPQVTRTTLTCSISLTVTAGPSCKLGSVSRSTALGAPALFEDACGGGDTMTVETTCAQVASDRRRKAAFRLNDFGDVVVTGTGAAKLTGKVTPTCRADIQVSSHACTGTNCMIRWEARVYGPTGMLSGTIEGMHAYTGYDASPDAEDRWTNGCEALDPGAKPGEGAES